MANSSNEECKGDQACGDQRPDSRNGSPRQPICHAHASTAEVQDDSKAFPQYHTYACNVRISGATWRKAFASLASLADQKVNVQFSNIPSLRTMTIK